MRKFFIYILLVFFLISINSVFALEVPPSPPSMREISFQQVQPHHSIPYCLGRGFTNILLGWIEIPHRMVYQGSEIPGFGLASGAIYGTLVTVWRALSGVTDLLSLGMGAGNVFFAQGLPDFPWNGPWIFHPPPPLPPVRNEPAKVTITSMPAAKTKENKSEDD